MAIQDDWTIDYTLKKIYHSSGTTVYTVNQLYSWLQNTFDELIQMDDPVPMSAQTPTEYTFINGWWLDIGHSGGSHYSHRYLKTGAIATDGYDATSYSDGIRLLKLKSSGYVSCVSGDIGREVGYSGGSPDDTGTLIGYENTLRYWWVRVDDTGDTFANTSTALDLDNGTGTGEGTIEDVDGSLTGEELYANIYTLGTITSDPYAQVYVYQAEEPVSEWSSLSNWDRGHIDVMLQVKEMGIEIDEAEIIVFNRQGGDLYDNFDIDLTAGGRNAVPLASSTDLDNETPDYYLLYDGETGGGFAIGDIVVGNSGAAQAEITSLTDWGTSGVLGLIGLSGTFADDEDIYVSGTKRGDANGTIGDIWFTYSENTGTVSVDDILRDSGDTTRRKVTGIQDDGATGKMTAKIDTTDTSNISKYYLPIVTATTYNDGSGNSIDTTSGGTESVAAWSDIKIFFVNLDLDYDNEQNGGFSVGDYVTGATSGSHGYVLYVDDQGTSGTLTIGNADGAFQDNENLQTGGTTRGQANGTGEIINTLNKAFEQQSAYPYDVIVDMNYYDLAASYKHPVAEMYEYGKFVTRWDSSYPMYRVQRPNGKVYGYDYNGGSGSTFTDYTTEWSDSTSNDVIPLTDADEVEDAFYVGSPYPFNKVHFNLTTAGTGTYGVTWEYYNGATWSALNWQGGAGVAEDTTDAHEFSCATGWHYVYFDMPTNWDVGDAVGTIEQDYYWVRARLSSGSCTVDPLLGEGYVRYVYQPEDGEEYIIAYHGYAPKKAAPLGTFAGGVFFGAQGVWIENMHDDDVQAYQLIDSNGTTRDPPNKQALTVTTLEAGDRVTVFRITGNGGDIDKALYTSTHTDNVVLDNNFVVDGSIATDTPTVGVLRIVDVSEEREHRVRYASWASSTFTFNTEISSQTDLEGTPTRLYDDDGDFSSSEIEIGDLIYNSTDASWAHVSAIQTNYLDTTTLQGGSDNDWESGDYYALHVLPVNYTSNDTIYVPFIDEQATGTSVSVTVIYTANRDILTRVRKKGIIPFEIEGDFISTGYTVAAIRTTDAIVS